MLQSSGGGTPCARPSAHVLLRMSSQCSIPATHGMQGTWSQAQAPAPPLSARLNRAARICPLFAPSFVWFQAFQTPKRGKGESFALNDINAIVVRLNDKDRVEKVVDHVCSIWGLDWGEGGFRLFALLSRLHCVHALGHTPHSCPCPDQQPSHHPPAPYLYPPTPCPPSGRASWVVCTHSPPELMGLSAAAWDFLAGP